MFIKEKIILSVCFILCISFASWGTFPFFIGASMISLPTYLDDDGSGEKAIIMILPEPGKVGETKCEVTSDEVFDYLTTESVDVSSLIDECDFEADIDKPAVVIIPQNPLTDLPPENIVRETMEDFNRVVKGENPNTGIVEPVVNGENRGDCSDFEVVSAQLFNNCVSNDQNRNCLSSGVSLTALGHGSGKESGEGVENTFSHQYSCEYRIDYENYQGGDTWETRFFEDYVERDYTYTDVQLCRRITDFDYSDGGKCKTESDKNLAYYSSGSSLTKLPFSVNPGAEIEFVNGNVRRQKLRGSVFVTSSVGYVDGELEAKNIQQNVYVLKKDGSTTTATITDRCSVDDGGNTTYCDHKVKYADGTQPSVDDIIGGQYPNQFGPDSTEFKGQCSPGDDDCKAGGDGDSDSDREGIDLIFDQMKELSEKIFNWGDDGLLRGDDGLGETEYIFVDRFVNALSVSEACPIDQVSEFGQTNIFLMRKFCVIWDDSGGRDVMGWFFYMLTFVGIFRVMVFSE